MKLQEIIETLSLKAAGRSVGLEVAVAEGRLAFTPTDPDDPRYSTDFILPSMRMVEACRADDFDFFLDPASGMTSTSPWPPSSRTSPHRRRRTDASTYSASSENHSPRTKQSYTDAHSPEKSRRLVD